MKKQILSLSIAAIILSGCTTEKPAGTTILGEGTPYSNYPEIMAGKVKTVVEKNYWATPDGDTYKKGNPLTLADRDSLGGWTDDFEAVYDENGVIVVCTGLDETGNKTWKNESVIENKKLAVMNLVRKDTLRIYDQFKYGDNGFMISGKRFRAGVDTLMISVNIKTNTAGYPIEFQMFNKIGEPIEKYIHIYDEQNRFIKQEVFDKNGNFTYSHEVKYNDKGKVSELILKDKDNKVTSSNYFTYEYDEKGNWVKAVVKDDKNHVVIEERSYTYFE
jgi:hypothetical protein